MVGLDMDYDSIQKAGSGLGSGAVIVMDETTCMVDTLYRISEFYMEESCGQCTPCREGTGWLVRLLHRIKEGHGEPGDIEKLVNVADNIEGRTIYIKVNIKGNILNTVSHPTCINAGSDLEELHNGVENS